MEGPEVIELEKQVLVEEENTNLIKLPLKPGYDWYESIGIPNLHNTVRDKNMEFITKREFLINTSDNEISFIPMELGLTSQENKLVDELLKLKSFYQNLQLFK